MGSNVDFALFHTTYPCWLLLEYAFDYAMCHLCLFPRLSLPWLCMYVKIFIFTFTFEQAPPSLTPDQLKNPICVPGVVCKSVSVLGVNVLFYSSDVLQLNFEGKIFCLLGLFRNLNSLLENQQLPTQMRSALTRFMTHLQSL